MATKKATTTKETKAIAVAKKTAPKKSDVKTTAANVSVRTPKSKANTKATSRRKKDTIETVEQVVTDEKSMMPSFGGRKIGKKTLAIIATLIVLGGLLYLAGKYAVIAWVDNRPITRFQLFSNLEKRYGKDMTEQLIVENLILSEARQKNMTVSDEEIATEIKKIEEQQGGADQLNQILQVQGISQSEFNNLIKLQLLRTKIFGEGIAITDQQIDEYIEQNRENIPTATEGASQADKDKLRVDVKEQLLQEQISTRFNEWLRNNLQGERVKRSS
jgi:hypothetical protein